MLLNLNNPTKSSEQSVSLQVTPYSSHIMTTTMRVESVCTKNWRRPWSWPAQSQNDLCQAICCSILSFWILTILNHSSFDDHAFTSFKYSAILSFLAWYSLMTCPVISCESLYIRTFFPLSCSIILNPANNTSYFASLFEALKPNLRGRFGAFFFMFSNTISLH